MLAHATLVEGMRERERELSTLSRKDKSGNIPTTKGSDNKFGNIKPRTKSVPVVDSTILLQRSVKATDKISVSICIMHTFIIFRRSIEILNYPFLHFFAFVVAEH